MGSEYISCSAAGSCKAYETIVKIAENATSIGIPKNDVKKSSENKYTCRIIGIAKDILADQASENPRYTLREGQINALRTFEPCTHLEGLNRQSEILNKLENLSIQIDGLDTRM